MKTKTLYEAPEAELLVVRFETGFLNGPSNPTSETFSTQTGDDDSEDGWD